MTAARPHISFVDLLSGRATKKVLAGEFKRLRPQFEGLADLLSRTLGLEVAQNRHGVGQAIVLLKAGLEMAFEEWRKEADAILALSDRPAAEAFAYLDAHPASSGAISFLVGMIDELHGKESEFAAMVTAEREKEAKRREDGRRAGLKSVKGRAPRKVPSLEVLRKLADGLALTEDQPEVALILAERYGVTPGYIRKLLKKI